MKGHVKDFYDLVCEKLKAKNIKYSKNIVEYVARNHHCVENRKTRKQILDELSAYLHVKTINKILQLINALETEGNTYTDCVEYLNAMCEAEVELSN